MTNAFPSELSSRLGETGGAVLLLVVFAFSAVTFLAWVILPIFIIAKLTSITDRLEWFKNSARGMSDRLAAIEQNTGRPGSAGGMGSKMQLPPGISRGP